jgi:DNA-directed RNA polymerase specialized sigma24 family protein
MRQRIAELIPRLRRYAKALGNGGTAPDELVRRTLERASRDLRLALTDADLRLWLFSLLHETYILAAGVQDAEELQPPPPPATVRNPEQAIAALPPLQRAVFLLVTLEDMSYQQVAKVLSIPVDTVISRLSRARETLRLLLIDAARVRAVK